MFSHLKPGDQVAVLPGASSPAEDVLEIAPVSYVGPVYIQLVDGRNHATLGGKSLLEKVVTYIMPVTDEHRAAMEVKCSTSA
ncbi:MAG TPA: hypothetical protein VGJ04_00725 [Pirellulales bacterium]